MNNTGFGSVYISTVKCWYLFIRVNMIPLTSICCALAAEAAHAVPSVNLSPVTEQHTYAVARWIMNIASWIVGLFGAGRDSSLFIWVYVIIVFGIAVGIGYLLTWMILPICRVIARHVRNDMYQYLVDAGFFAKAAKILPALLFLILIEFTLNLAHHSLASWMSRLTWIYLLYVVARCVVIIISVAWHHIDQRENKRKLPLRGLVQLVKGIVWIVFVIVAAAIIVDKSPTSVLAGLGAFAAVLMLVFKDSILGVVAGVQLSENDSLHVGDWIAVGDANGSVTEVSLTSVSIQNWDKTTSHVPPYTLISSGFKNYRSMQTSLTRRIQRNWLIDARSVVVCDDAMLKEFSALPLVADWIAAKIAQKEKGDVCNAANPAGLVNGTIETNIGVFRAYLELYLKQNDGISHDSDCFVTTLQPTAEGFPLQIYCFTSTSSWIPYEAIQSALFEHIAVMMPKFGLRLYERPTGRDMLLEGKG